MERERETERQREGERERETRLFSEINLVFLFKLKNPVLNKTMVFR